MNHRPTIFTPDAQYDDDGDIERRESGPDVDWLIYRERSMDRIPAEAFEAADALVTWHVMRVDADFISRLPKCRIIVRAGVGFDHIDLAAAGRAGIPVCNTPDYGISEVADHAIGLMLALRRGITVFDGRLKADPANGFAKPAPPLMQRNRGGTFGIVGVGVIGLATGLRAKAFGMRIVIYDPYAPAGVEIAAGFERTDDFDEFLATADVISIHCPLTDETRGLFNARAMARMKKTAILINTARGPVVDAGALVDALESGAIGGAALDVFAAEPIPADSPLSLFVRSGAKALAEGRLILTPHASWMSPESAADVRRLSVRTAMQFLGQGRLRNLVNRKDLAEAGQSGAPELAAAR